MTIRAGLVQLSVGDDPDANLPVTRGLVEAAAAQGATLVLTPAMGRGPGSISST